MKKPDDAVHSSIFAIEAEHIDDRNNEPPTFTQFPKPDPFGDSYSKRNSYMGY